MAQTDRTTGLVGNTGIKQPVKAATTANIVLTGAQVLDGIACVTDDRVLVKNQTVPSENGIYVVDTGAWSRAKDFDGSYDIVQGTMVRVNQGATLAQSYWAVSSADPLMIGTSSIAFAQVNNSLLGVSAFVQTLIALATAAAFRNSIGIAWCGTATGTANALTLTPAEPITALVAGIELVFKSSAAPNSAATTIAVSGLAATAVQSNGAACVGGEIEASKWYRATYDGVAFQLERLAPAVLLEMFTTKGDTLIATADQKVTRKAAPTAGTLRTGDTTTADGVRDIAPLRSGLFGLTYANNVGDAVNDIDIAAGGAVDATNAYWMALAAITKQSDAAWAVGTNQGGLDLIASAGNNDFYIWLIARSDTGVVDALFSLSSTAPTMPANYDFKRLIGWFKRVGGTIVAFHTYETEGGGIELSWDVPTLDVNLANTLTTARRTDAVKVPLNFSVLALLNVVIDDASAGSINWVYCPDKTDGAPATATAPLGNVFSSTANNGVAQIRVRTSAAGLIAARSSLATTDNYKVSTMGFNWARRA